jgi:hypothetical protein
MNLSMPDWSSIHKPVLVNTVGHCAGVVVFGMLLWLFLANRSRGREYRSTLPAVASALAMLWNLGSLLALAAGPAGGAAVNIAVAASFAVLSLLPAVLLHIFLQSHRRPLWIAGYVVSTAAVVLHIADLAARSPRLHSAALRVVIFGFAGLTTISVILEMQHRNRAAGSRLAAAMGLFLLAVSFAHFGAEPDNDAWLREVVFHHAGLPLALLVLLQDYRFLLLDAFLRFLVNASLAAGGVLLAIRTLKSPGLARSLEDPFRAGILFVGACLIVVAFVYLRNRLQAFLTRVIFLRSNIDHALLELSLSGRAARNETDYLSQAAGVIARFLRASRFDLAGQQPTDYAQITVPLAVLDANRSTMPWIRAILPFRFSAGDGRFLLLGPRDGGRRYLSEDFAIMARLGAAVTEHVERLRRVQMQSLVSQAELKALQAQINPHFLFNSLNTLYGTIDRSNVEARRLVLDLADVFRYLLASDRTFIELAEELRIVRSYLDIETMRLGPRLRTEIKVDDAALQATIPLLSIQPLVENAVKHGVAPRSGDGFVSLVVRTTAGTVVVEVSNSGECEVRNLLRPNGGIGLANVRRRLALCYGSEAHFQAFAENGVTRVEFVLPLRASETLAAVAGE